MQLMSSLMMLLLSSYKYVDCSIKSRTEVHIHEVTADKRVDAI